MTAAPPINSVLAHDPRNRQWLLFQNPVRVIRADRPEAVTAALRRIEQAVSEEGLHAAGFVAYEAAPAFDPALITRPASAFPLVWFGLYHDPEPVTLPRPSPGVAEETAWEPDVRPETYQVAIRRVKEAIRDGDTYQVNYTFRLRAPFAGEGWPLFLRMIAAQGPGYGAYVALDGVTLCCASPELFFRLDGDRLESKPMKGTAPRGLTAEADADQARRLVEQEKTRAENVMIVDMVRNDMGRVADTGSVCVPRLFEAEQYPTLWQMTSTVEGRTEAGLTALFGALFPPASITGAPKARTMQIIAELESSPRRIYTGSIGFLSPGRQAQFNVAIRTVLVDTARQKAEYGVGGGIVWDSETDSEWEECLTKAKVLTASMPAFDLLETIRWTPGEGYARLDDHLRRLEQSARYFGRPLSIPAILDLLHKRAETFSPAPQRVRLTVAEGGSADLYVRPLTPLPNPYRVRLATNPVASGDRFLYHKTTNRTVYKQAMADASGFDDVLLWNERGELTESCIANLVMERNGRLVTPPVESGLLPGVERAALLREGRIEEGVIRVADLANGARLFLINSVRGMWEATGPGAG